MKKTNFLTELERQELKAQHRKEKNRCTTDRIKTVLLANNRRTADRIKTVLLADKGWNYNTITNALLLDEETIGIHIKEYIENKKLTISSGGSESKHSDDQTKELIFHLEARTYLKALQICDYIKKTYSLKYTVSGITEWLKRNGFSYRKPHVFPAKAQEEKQAEFISEYEKLKKETPEEEPILFFDAVYPTMATKVTYNPNLNPIERLWKVLNKYVRNNVYFDCAKKFKNEVLNFFNKTWDDIRLTMKSRINDNFQILTKSRV